MLDRRFDPESLRFDARLRADVERTAERVRETGRTRWLAHVIEAPVDDPIGCYAHAGLRDRFLWQRVEADQFFCAWGSVDETESAGPTRFDDVRGWWNQLRGRLDWTGAARPSRAPCFMGGFGFEEEPNASADWKAFPAARFVLPEVIIERWQGVERWVLFQRVEKGATSDGILRKLTERLEDAAAANTPPCSSDVAVDQTGIVDVMPSEPADWSAGPEYVVRADRSHATFRAQIRAALAGIEQGRLDKVVLARSLSVDHDGDFGEVAFFDRLRSLYPSCTLIAVGRARDTFVAATPERLVHMEGRRVETAALAGSAPRGRQPEEDRALGDGLLHGEKERAEHAHVVTAIRDVLDPLCSTLEISAAPRLRRLFGIQHLETPIRGELRGGDGEVIGDRAVDAAEGSRRESDATAHAGPHLLELARALHPTPAVGGLPVEAAKSWLRHRERLERGWYAAPVGWLDLDGGGDLRVALRSALIRNGLGTIGQSGASRALLFGGAGIVAGSDPESELVETRIKLRALLAPLTEI